MEAKGAASRQLSQLHLSPQKVLSVTQNSLGFVLKLHSFVGRNTAPAYGHMGVSIYYPERLRDLMKGLTLSESTHSFVIKMQISNSKYNIIFWVSVPIVCLAA